MNDMDNAKPGMSMPEAIAAIQKAQEEVKANLRAGRLDQLPGAKHDTGKLPISTVPPQIVRDIAAIRAYGLAKYAQAEDWRRVGPERFFEAFLRHVLAMMENPTGVDPESGHPHYKHAACNLAFLCDFYKAPDIDSSGEKGV